MRMHKIAGGVLVFGQMWAPAWAFSPMCLQQVDRGPRRAEAWADQRPAVFGQLQVLRRSLFGLLLPSIFRFHAPKLISAFAAFHPMPLGFRPSPSGMKSAAAHSGSNRADECLL